MSDTATRMGVSRFERRRTVSVRSPGRTPDRTPDWAPVQTPGQTPAAERRGSDSRRRLPIRSHGIVWLLRPLRPLASRLPAGFKARLRRWLGIVPRPAVVTIPRQVALGRGARHAGFFAFEGEGASGRGARMGPRALVRLEPSPPGALRIVGEWSLDARETAALVLRVALEGDALGELHLAGGAFDVELPLERGVPTEAPLELEAVPDGEAEGALRILRIELGGRPVVDFAGGWSSARSRPGAPASCAFNLIGYLRSEVGVGESARLCAASAEAADIPVSLIDYSVACASRARDRRWAKRIGRSHPHSVNLIHVNADQMRALREALGPGFFRDRYNIGFWHWELPEFPDEWLGSFGLVDEVWVPSRFVADSVAAKSPVPVVRMPHGISVAAPAGTSRRRFGLPDGDFLFLALYDMHSGQPRKNPEGAIEAYRRAFPDGRGVGLVIKTMNAATDPERSFLLRERLRDVPGVHLLDRTLSREDVYGLESVCDCVVSLHRAEGFGLTLAECMALGKPAIATGWSGNTDFMDTRNACLVGYALKPIERDVGPYRAGQTWAEPDVEHAAWYMRRLVADAELCQRLAWAGRETVRRELSPIAIGERYRQRLEVLPRVL